MVKINIRLHTYSLELVYRSRNINIDEFGKVMCSILVKVASKPCYIMGDYNLDLRKHEMHHTDFLDAMYANYHVSLLNCSTRVTRESSTRITSHILSIKSTD